MNPVAINSGPARRLSMAWMMTRVVASIASMAEVSVHAVSLEQTRLLRQTILRPHETLEELAGHEPPHAFAVGALDGDELVAVGFVVPDGEVGAWRIRGMATAPWARGRGIGAAVLDALIQHAVTQGARRIWCNARTPARSLYERAGLRVVSDEFELPQIGPHLLMELEIAKPQHHSVPAP